VTIVRILSAVAVACSLAGAAGAQTDACDPQSGPPSPDFEFYAAEQWPQEAARYKGAGQLVAREGTRLRLKLDDGKTLELADCPHGITAHVYLYERYDEIGRFFVVRRPAFKDFSYMLVMSATGKSITVYSTPIWAQDRSRFMTIACSWLPPRGTLTIHRRAGGAITAEVEIPLPTCLDETESCSARWDNASWIAVTCTPTDGSSRRGSEFVVMRGSGNDSSWKTFGR
jgi:hypothetical protein